MATLKLCGLCRQRKPLTEFYVNRSRKDNVQAYCKACWKQYTYPSREAWERRHKRVELPDGTRPRVPREPVQGATSGPVA